MKVLCHSAGHQVSPSQAASFPHSLPEADSWATQSTTLGVSHFSEKKPHVLEPELMPQGLGLSFLPLTGGKADNGLLESLQWEKPSRNSACQASHARETAPSLMNDCGIGVGTASRAKKGPVPYQQ